MNAQHHDRSRFIATRGAVTTIWLLFSVACSSSEPSSNTPDEGRTQDTPSTSEKERPKGDQPSGEMAAILAEHNRARAEHCAPPLVWSNKLAKTAQAWANELQRNQCAFEHSQSTYGENLAAGTERIMTPEHVVDMWFKERAAYNFKRGDFTMESGHFTQLVWASSQSLGCGNVTCNGLKIWVCNYDPAGNVQGEFQRNVQPTSCK